MLLFEVAASPNLNSRRNQDGNLFDCQKLIFYSHYLLRIEVNDIQPKSLLILHYVLPFPKHFDY